MNGLLPTRAARSPSPSASFVTSPHLYRPRSTSRVPAPTPLLRFLSYIGLNPRDRRPHHLRPPSKFTLRSLITPATLILLPVWLLLIFHTEHWTYTSHLRACDWDSWENWPAGAQPHRIALIADPQLVDVHTYSRRGPALWATIFYTDLYLRRNWNVLNSDLLPQETIFLGDLFDGGREWGVADHRDTHSQDEVPIPKDPKGDKDWVDYGNAYWFKEYRRFIDIFSLPAGSRSYRSLPGNHDLGFGTGVKRSVRERFEAYLGDTNRVWQSGNHTFVAIDTVSLSNENDAAVFGPTQEFLESLASSDHADAGGSTLINLNAPAATRPFPHALHTEYEKSATEPALFTKKLPTVLLTHVPLYRSDGTPCGPLRERGSSIPIWKGYQYQNVLSPELSQKLLATVSPKWVFSGDDHDACEVTHSGMVKEVTVKSASWAMGVRRPAFYLLSLWNPERSEGRDGVTLKGKMCLLPDMIGGLLRYVWMLVVSLLVVAVHVGYAEVRRKRKGKAPMILPGGGDGKYAKKRRVGEEGVMKRFGRELGKVVALVGPLYVLIVWWW